MVLIDKMYKVHLNDEHKAVMVLLLKAREIGKKAAQEQFSKLQKAGSKWAVKDSATNKLVGGMLDVCGFASMRVPGRSKIVKAFKKLGEKTQYEKEYIYDRMRISKSYYSGYNLNINLNIGRQEMSVNEEAVFAASEFLNNAGLKCDWESRIDWGERNFSWCKNKRRTLNEK